MPMPGPWKKTEAKRAEERETNTGVNSEVVSYFLPLDEVWKRWGKPGDTQNYVSPPLYGTSRKGER